MVLPDAGDLRQRMTTPQRSRTRRRLLAALLAVGFALHLLAGPLHLAVSPHVKSAHGHGHAHDGDRGEPHADEGDPHAPHPAQDHLDELAKLVAPASLQLPVAAMPPAELALPLPSPILGRRLAPAERSPRAPPPRRASVPRAPPIVA